MIGVLPQSAPDQHISHRGAGMDIIEPARIAKFKQAFLRQSAACSGVDISQLGFHFAEEIWAIFFAPVS